MKYGVTNLIPCVRALLKIITIQSAILLRTYRLNLYNEELRY